MKGTAAVTSKGQITVPLDIRTRLGLREGDRIEFISEGEITYIRPLRGTPNPFAEFEGVLGEFSTVEEINRWVDDLRSE